MDFKEEREKLGISQKEFAEIIGVSPSTVCQWESGKSFPNKRIAKLLSFIFRSPDFPVEISETNCLSAVTRKEVHQQAYREPDPDLSAEEWRTIHDFPDYSVSSFGRVRKNKTNKIVRSFLNNSGYERVSLTHNGISKHCLVHRLVAMAFIENPLNYPVINHKDENKTNNNVSNLEWCDIAYNNNYGTARHRRIKSRLNNAKKPFSIKH